MNSKLYLSLNEFWLGIRAEFPTIFEMAINILLPFFTRYLCEMTFLLIKMFVYSIFLYNLVSLMKKIKKRYSSH